jgi:serine/threonine protein kinase, bacterial
MRLAAGEEFAGYTILRVLGAGGMGTVYLAQHPRLPRQDALKVLSADLTVDPQFRARFLREADIAATLSHPNIVSIYDRGEHDGQLWISMAFVAGSDAAQMLRERYRQGMPIEQALEIVTAVASALDYAHQRGLLHRDVKPANILLADPDSEARRIYLADFGIARRADDTAGLTATNVAVGTVAYAAPEQLMGELVDGRTDQYALACTAFHLLTGTEPYDTSTPAAAITKHVTAPPPSISQKRPELAQLDPVFAKAMAKAPTDRFSRCQDFIGELRRNLHPAYFHMRQADAGPTNVVPGPPTATPPPQPPRVHPQPPPLTRQTPSAGATPAPTPGPYSDPSSGPGYGYPDTQQAPAGQVTRTNALAVIALISSLVGWIVCVGSIAGIVLGVIAVNQIRRKPQAGKGLAIAAIVAGIIGVLFWLIFVIYSAAHPETSRP